MKAKEFNIKKRDPNWRAMQDIRRSGAGGQHKDKKKAAKQGEVKHKGQMAEGVDIGKEWMSDTELDQYVPDRLQDEWRELVGYDIEGKAHPLWANMTGGYEPDVNDPEDRANMVKVANKWFSMKKIPNVKFYDVKDADDELEWLVQIGEQGVSEGADELYGIRIGDTVTTEFNGRKVQGDVIDLFPDDMQVELLLRGPESGRTIVVDVRDTEFFEDADSDEPDEQYLDKVISDLHKDALGFRPDQEFGREWMSSSFEEKLEIYNKLLKSLHNDVDEGIGGMIAGGVGQFIGNKIDPLAGEIMRAHGEIAGRKAEYTIRKYMHLLQKALKQQLDSGGKSNENMREDSDFGEPREILEDVLRTLEREVEWPLTDVMDPREVKQLLSPIVKAVNDKMLSMDEGWNDQDDWGSMSHREFKRRELEHELGHEDEMANYAVIINSKKWKVFDNKRAAEKAAMTIKQKYGKDTDVVKTMERPSK